IGWPMPSNSGSLERTNFGAELRPLGFDIAFYKQRNEIADRAPVKAGVFLLHDCGDIVRLDLGVHLDEPAGQLLDDLLFTQLDHMFRVLASPPTVNRAGHWPQKRLGPATWRSTGGAEENTSPNGSSPSKMS